MDIIAKVMGKNFCKKFVTGAGLLLTFFERWRIIEA